MKGIIVGKSMIINHIQLKLIMRIFLTAVVLIFFSLISVSAQSFKATTTADKPTLTWGGFVKAEGMYDTRQVVEAREGYLLLYPKKVSPDKNGKDINAHGSFNQYAMTARLSAKVTGPDILHAKASALIEGDFTGASNSENNSFRLRQAYLKLQWTHASLTAGQYWHPLNIPEMIPNVLSLNTGAPFHPFSRQPQVRLDASKGKINTMLALTAQRDYVNNGPAGNSSVYLRNSVIPNLNGQVQYVTEKLFAGIGLDFKRLTPRLVTDSLYATDAAVNCISYTAFAMTTTKPLIIKMQLIYGQGINDHLVMGGYGVASTETVTNQQEYTPLNYLSGWINVQTTGKHWQGSLFAGYTKGFGANDPITGCIYARDADIDYVYRFSPMLSYINGKLLVATEIEFTTAAYGTPDKNYKVVDALPVSNTRISFSVGYFF
jgi:hypothetical protein